MGRMPCEEIECQRLIMTWTPWLDHPLAHEIEIRLARAARGGMRDAISLLDQLRTFCGTSIDADSAREVLGLAGLETVRPFLEALQEERPGDALEALNDALDRLETHDPAMAELVKLSFFAGLSLDEAAAAMGIPRATAYRHWTFARAWLHDAMTGGDRN